MSWRIRTYKYRLIILSQLTRGVSWLFGVTVPPKASAAAFIERDGRFLVLDLTYRSGYNFPGGLCDPGENLEGTIHREVHEETGLIVTNVRYVGSAESFQYGIPVIVAAFAVEVAPDAEVASEEGGLHWLPPAEILVELLLRECPSRF